jgi:hypothetical protein
MALRMLPNWQGRPRCSRVFLPHVSRKDDPSQEPCHGDINTGAEGGPPDRHARICYQVPMEAVIDAVPGQPCHREPLAASKSKSGEDEKRGNGDRLLQQRAHRVTYNGKQSIVQGDNGENRRVIGAVAVQPDESAEEPDENSKYHADDKCQGLLS